mgnify:CR=1 FL=1
MKRLIVVYDLPDYSYPNHIDQENIEEFSTSIKIYHNLHDVIKCLTLKKNMLNCKVEDILPEETLSISINKCQI